MATVSFNGQSAQDYFVLKCLNYKKNGIFVEIGSNDPIAINNSYILEKNYNWSGMMIEYESKYEEGYKLHRPNSVYIIKDARKINYLDEFKKNNFSKIIDYLQIDLEVTTKSTIDTLEELNKQVMDEYKFSVITFEHDIYVGNYFNTRERSREIFKDHGYIRVFSDVKNKNLPYEDWYVHPELVDMNFINKIKTDDSLEYTEIISILDNIKN